MSASPKRERARKEGKEEKREGFHKQNEKKKKNKFCFHSEDWKGASLVPTLSSLLSFVFCSFSNPPFPLLSFGRAVFVLLWLRAYGRDSLGTEWQALIAAGDGNSTGSPLSDVNFSHKMITIHHSYTLSDINFSVSCTCTPTLESIVSLTQLSCPLDRTHLYSLLLCALCEKEREKRMLCNSV